jgi:predicted Zn finger-like uncharacterized protein
MSLKTRCPACDTVFKIVPDQLKVSKGWVRCGRCAEVFDAAAHAAAADEANPWPQTSPPTTAPAPVIASPLAASSDESKITPKNIAAKAINTPATAILKAKIEANTSTFDERDLSFIRIAKNKAFWQRAAVTRTLSAACIGLAGLLSMQVVYSQRNHLAASNASFKSGLDTVCQTVGCTIEPHKNIDAFKIDSSSFQKTPTVSAENSRAEVFALKLSLKNNADMPLAIPAVELTLTEAGDKPVLRRVLLAKELGFTGTTLAANGDWAGTATVTITPNPAAAPVSGYRVLLFYP